MLKGLSKQKNYLSLLLISIYKYYEDPENFENSIYSILNWLFYIIFNGFVVLNKFDSIWFISPKTMFDDEYAQK